MIQNKQSFENFERYITLTQNDVDPMRHIFVSNDIIYRGIVQKRKKITEELFEKGVIANLINEGLITPSKIMDSGFNGYSKLVEQNELLSPVSSNELPPSLKRDVGLVLLKIVAILDQYDMTLFSYDYGDIFINKQGKPIFHNLDSIIYNEGTYFKFSEFYANFLGPLGLLSEKPELANVIQYNHQVTIDEDLSIRWPNLRRMVRILSTKGTIGSKINRFYFRIIMSPFYGLINTRQYWIFIRMALTEKSNRKNGLKNSTCGWTIPLIMHLQKKLNRLKFDAIHQKWTDYHIDLNLVEIINSKNEWKKHFYGPREKALLKVLDSVDGGSVLDIGANNGYFSLLSAHQGFVTTAIDYDIGAIDRLYRMLKESNSILPIRPLILNFSNMDSEASERFNSDVVFALGFLHHMRLVELLPWHVIVKKLSDLTGKILVTEYKNDTGASNSKAGIDRNLDMDYTLENLIEALEIHFSKVEVLGEYSQVGADSIRTMIMCRR